MWLLKQKKLVWLFILFSAIYVAQSVLVKPTQDTLDKYNIGNGQYVFIVLTLAIPYLVIWLIAAVGYTRLRDYTQKIKASKDGAAFQTISQGILLLTLWLPISTLLGNLATQDYNLHASHTANLIRLINYLNILILVPAFLLINRGSYKLATQVKSNLQSPSQWVMYGYIIFTGLYVFLTLHDPARYHATASSVTAAYYEPDWLIITSLVIPRLLMWFLGIQAAQNMYIYRTKVKGTIYRESLKRLSQGIGVVVVSTIVLRCVQSFGSTIGEWSLAAVLLLVYILIALIGIGYILIAKGARSLQKIEEF